MIAYEQLNCACVKVVVRMCLLSVGVCVQMHQWIKQLHFCNTVDSRVLYPRADPFSL